MSANQNTIFMLETAFHGMDQGLLVVAADLSVPLLNVRATELIDLPRSFSIDPPTFPEILAYQVEKGAITPSYMKSSINDFIMRGDILTDTHTYTRKTAAGRWLDVRTTPLPQGGFVRTFTDQTERHELAIAKRASDDAYRNLFENAAIGIYQSSADGKQLRANPELVALNGYHCEQDLLRSVSDIANEWYVEPGRRAKFKEILERDGRITEFESEVYRHLTRERIWISETAWAVRDTDGNVISYGGTVVEITERKKLEQLINHAAHHDGLTGLQNRAKFNQTLSEELANKTPIFLAYLDLDGFKKVNDTYGHGYGDELLIAVAGRFTNVLRSDTAVFRIGGDEFAIIMKDDDPDNIRPTLDRLVGTAERPFQIGDQSVTIGVSIGVAASRPDVSASDFLHLADMALYKSKAIGGSTVSFQGVDVTPTRHARKHLV